MSETAATGDDSMMLLRRIESLEARSARLQARAAIRELVSDYAHGTDEQDADRFIGVWHSDGVFDIGAGYGKVVGHDAIRASLLDVWAASTETRHWITDVTVEFSDDERATGAAHSICFMHLKDGRQILTSVWYDNVYAKREGVWRIAECRIEVHWWKQLPLLER
jgi:uncharacterized protein (TIGR02246 family)